MIETLIVLMSIVLTLLIVILVRGLYFILKLGEHFNKMEYICNNTISYIQHLEQQNLSNSEETDDEPSKIGFNS
jgi:hypothetical protein